MNPWILFKELILDVLIYIESFVGDWGLAIIVLTVFVRLILLPFTVKQTKSMYELQRIQPKLKELQNKYKDDKQKLQEETLKFYEEHKVNPLGGCLPTLIQMPLLFALYQVLGGTAKAPGIMIKYLEAQGATGTFYGIIPDIAMTPSAVYATQGLAAAIPYVLLVIIFALSIWIPQALMPGERQQKMIGASMAVMMLFFGWTAPAGVLLYWDVSSLWGIAQQQIIIASMKRGYQTPDEIVVEEPKLSEKPASNKAKGKKGSAKKKS